MAADEAAGLVESGAIEDDTLIYSDQAGFPFDGWTAWSDCSYLFGIGEAPEGGGGTGGGQCTALYYDGGDEEVPFAEIAGLIEAGTITEETLVFSDQDAFPFEGWTEWGECSEYFGEGGEEGGCTTLSYTNDGETTEEATADELPGLVASGAINDETNVFSTDDGFSFEGWTEYGECKHLFAGAEEEGEAEPEISEGVPGEVDETEKAQQAMEDTLGADQAAKDAIKAEKEAAAAAEAQAIKDAEAAEKKAKMDAKKAELDAARAAQEAEKAAEAKAKADAEAADIAARDEAGLSPIPTTIEAATLEASGDADFEKYFKMDKAKWASLPPFRLPAVKKAAMQRWVEEAEAENTRREQAWAKTKADAHAALKKSADSRLAIGQFIAEKGYEALLMGSQRILEETAIMHGPLKETTGMGWNGKTTRQPPVACAFLLFSDRWLVIPDKYCMVWPAVRVPNIPPGDKFFFLYSKKGAAKPDRVAYLQPGKFKVAKSKQKGVSGESL